MGDHASRGIGPEALEPGRTYRVDHRHEQLRRSFRFGKPGRQVVQVSTILAIDER